MCPGNFRSPSLLLCSGHPIYILLIPSCPYRRKASQPEQATDALATKLTKVIRLKLQTTRRTSKYATCCSCYPRDTTTENHSLPSPISHFQTFPNQAMCCFVNRVVPTESYLQFSRAPTMANFGDLPRGEIPEPLKYNRPMCKARFSIFSPLYLRMFIYNNWFDMNRELNPRKRNQSGY